MFYKHHSSYNLVIIITPAIIRLQHIHFYHSKGKICLSVEQRHNFTDRNLKDIPVFVQCCGLSNKT